MIAQRLHFLLQFLLSSQIYEGNCRESIAEVDPGEVRRLKSKSYYVGTHLRSQLTIKRLLMKQAHSVKRMDFSWFWNCWLHSKIIFFLPIQLLKVNNPISSFLHYFPKIQVPLEKWTTTLYRHKYKGSTAITAHWNDCFHNDTLKT